MTKPFIALLTIALVPFGAFAIDGVVLINQSTVIAAGGFPYKITQPGSYKLTGNLTMPNENTNGIVITASHVTVDLNGFSILGPTDCSGGLSPCARLGSGAGISTPREEFTITIRNGTVQGAGGIGINLFDDSHLVEYMHVRSNGSGGIFITQSIDSGSSIVQHNTVQRNGIDGIAISQGLVTHNVIDTNGGGIFLEIGTASYNVVTRSASAGLVAHDGASYVGNVLNGNSPNVSGGVNLGQNLCGNSVCPGALF